MSVDIPSGWDVEKGDLEQGAFVPGQFPFAENVSKVHAVESDSLSGREPNTAALISLTAPKMGVRQYADEGRVHWLAGRFIGP